ncbi:MAG: bi-domain-containing oxidoreductase [Acidobacteriaceae bacterium]|nr:bi-domain-containing oxidoreductase [Acidobacteriaceae bacterium]
MKQVVRKGLKDIVVEELPDPLVTPHHVIVCPHFSLISSGTESASIHQEGVLKQVSENPSHIRKIVDAAKTMGPVRTMAEVRAKFSEYAVLGYSGAGVIVDKHPTVKDLELGERVAYGGEGTGHGEMILAGRQLAARVPPDLPLDQACFATLGSIAMNAVRIAQIGIGETVAVIGQGLVGQLVSQLVRVQGGVVVAIDLKQDRTDLARKLGADVGVLGGDGALEGVKAATVGRGADCVIVAAAAKSAAPCLQALSICRDRGRIVVLGAVEMNFPWHDMYLKEIQLFMSRAYGPGSYDPQYERNGHDYPLPYVRWTENRNMEEFLRLLDRKAVDVSQLITHRFTLSDAAAAYRTILDRASQSLAVVLQYPAAESLTGVSRPVHRIDLPRCTKAEQLKIALVGAGNLARWVHLPDIRKFQNVGLRAVYSASGARGKSYAVRFKADYCASNYDEILRDPEIDAVLIATRNQHHAQQALDALSSGKHVFVEKPMALTEDECIALERAVAESRLVLTVGFNRRFAPYYVAVRRQLQKRTGPAVITCRVNSPGISGSYWMADPALGGAILGEACHFVDLLYWLTGSEPISVSAYSLPRGNQEPIGENNLVAIFRFADGSVANLSYSTIGSRTSAGERLEVFAQGIGAATEDFKKLSLRGNMRRNRSRFWAAKGYEEQLKDFFDSIREGRTPAVTVRDGSRATMGCLRMLDSARHLAPMSFDLPG